MLSPIRRVNDLGRRSGAVAVLALILLLPLLSACEDDGLVEMAAEMALEWAEGRSLVSVSGEGDISVNYGQIALYQVQRAGNYAIGRGFTTNDEALDAALDIAPIAKDIRDADKLAAEGMASDDPTKMDEAIAARPNDWNYRDQKAAVLAANGDSEGASDAIAESEQLVNQRVADGGNCRGLKQNMLRGREQALEQQLAGDPENPVLLDLLARTRAELYALNNSEANSPCP
jgi:hypothetical protein